jgi:hypothetical protein
MLQHSMQNSTGEFEVLVTNVIGLQVPNAKGLRACQHECQKPDSQQHWDAEKWVGWKPALRVSRRVGTPSIKMGYEHGTFSAACGLIYCQNYVHNIRRSSRRTGRSHLSRFRHPSFFVYNWPSSPQSECTRRQRRVRDILLMTPPEDVSKFQALLGDGNSLEFNCNMRCSLSRKESHRLSGETFIGNNACALVLGDNIFYGHDQAKDLREAPVRTRGRKYMRTPFMIQNARKLWSFDGSGWRSALKKSLSIQNHATP